MPDYASLAQKYNGSKDYAALAQKYSGAAQEPQQQDPSIFDEIKQGAGNVLAGGIRGAGSIGATLMWPIDKATDLIQNDRNPSVADLIKGTKPLSRNEQRRREIDNGLRWLGAQPDSFLYKAGKLGGEIAGTAGAGGAVANGVRAVAPALAASPMGAAALDALASGGLKAGGVTGLKGMALRMGGGAINGGLTSGMVNPSDATTGALVGGILPAGIKAGGYIGNKIGNAAKTSAQSLMQSALKPTIKQLKSGDAQVAVNTLLDLGINPNAAGVDKLRGAIGSVNDDIASRIAQSNAQIDKQSVVGRLSDLKQRFANQVTPGADLSAIDSAGQAFLNHPNFQGATIPVQDAQALKQGTYQILAKKYGQLGSADIEAQKALARGLKEEISNAVPEVAGLNQYESNLLRTLNVAERRQLMELNKNPMGLASLAKNPAGWAMFMADKSALFKSLAARMLNSSGANLSSGVQKIGNSAADPLIRAAPILVGNSE